ncbi:Cytoplasmic tRNA 2-thiolation protein 2 B [Sarcoptes scabiei]|nr:Cytoplasmic tRNA 2-thiolation protein 2 B [Sarcoptes scabiei]
MKKKLRKSQKKQKSERKRSFGPMQKISNVFLLSNDYYYTQNLFDYRMRKKDPREMDNIQEKGRNDSSLDPSLRLDSKRFRKIFNSSSYHSIVIDQCCCGLKRRRNEKEEEYVERTKTTFRSHSFK